MKTEQEIRERISFVRNFPRKKYDKIAIAYQQGLINSLKWVLE